jgi:hypothetical protein
LTFFSYMFSRAPAFVHCSSAVIPCSRSCQHSVNVRSTLIIDAPFLVILVSMIRIRIRSLPRDLDSHQPPCNGLQSWYKIDCSCSSRHEEWTLRLSVHVRNEEIMRLCTWNVPFSIKEYTLPRHCTSHSQRIQLDPYTSKTLDTSLFRTHAGSRLMMVKGIIHHIDRTRTFFSLSVLCKPWLEAEVKTRGLIRSTLPCYFVKTAQSFATCEAYVFG